MQHPHDPHDTRDTDTPPSIRKEERQVGPPLKLPSVWQPRAVERPSIDPELTRYGWARRSAMVVRHALNRLEHWLSPLGTLREILRIGLWVAIALTVLSAIVLPPVSGVLQGLVQWTGMAAQAVTNITLAVTGLPPIVVGLASLWLIAKVIKHYRDRRRPGRGYPDGY